jgi:hypothetical protein
VLNRKGAWPVLTPASIALDGRVSIVTGGAQGIGRATAEALVGFYVA